MPTVMRREASAELVRRRLSLERGRVDKQAPFTVALTYPSPYFVAMSSLGMRQIYGAIQAADGLACERVFLPDDAGGGPIDDEPRSYESLRPLSEFPVVALSVAYELQLAGLVQLLEGAHLPALRADRDERHPIVVAGGPLTFSNPLPLAAFADAIVMGEADVLAVEALSALRDTWEGPRSDALAALARLPHVYVPELHGDAVPSIARCDDSLLPARSALCTPETELSDMFLIEAERGCPRRCAYCVMRGRPDAGMRLVDKARLLDLVPDEAKRVGLVGAAVSDHPDITAIVSALVERGAEVGLSSLRPDRLDDGLVAALAAAGYRTLTTAMDGASERLRGTLDRRTKERHLRAAAELARRHKIARLKLYLMVGVPSETDDDIAECAAFLVELSKLVPVSLAVAPFCAKRNTPLDGQPYAGIKTVDARLDLLRRSVKGRVTVRATSARWAAVEHALSQGGQLEGQAVRDAVLAGGSYAAFRRAFEARGANAPR